MKIEEKKKSSQYGVGNKNRTKIHCRTYCAVAIWRMWHSILHPHMYGFDLHVQLKCIINCLVWTFYVTNSRKLSSIVDCEEGKNATIKARAFNTDTHKQHAQSTKQIW